MECSHLYGFYGPLSLKHNFKSFSQFPCGLIGECNRSYIRRVNSVFIYQKCNPAYESLGFSCAGACNYGNGSVLCLSSFQLSVIKAHIFFFFSNCLYLLFFLLLDFFNFFFFSFFVCIFVKFKKLELSFYFISVGRTQNRYFSVFSVISGYGINFSFSEIFYSLSHQCPGFFFYQLYGGFSDYM